MSATETVALDQITTLSTPVITLTTSQLTWADHWDHFLARWGVNRSGHRVTPGLYALGRPTPTAPVFVTANYTLSFDALRAALAGRDSYLLVLETHGINVWCAAGKGTFGTDELVRRVRLTNLRDVVRHRTLILPQLGAPGIAAHIVQKSCGFKVEYGPVRAADLPAYLQTRQATPAMRQVRFPLRDRLVLIPVELTALALPLLILGLLGILGVPGMWAAAAALLAGTVLFPILLPWLPTTDFSAKGFLLGVLTALPFAFATWLGNPEMETWQRAVWALSYLLWLPPITAFLSLNFTGSTPFTSRSGVQREIFAYIPRLAWLFGGGLALTGGVWLSRWLIR